jgi:hypothetical protein
MNKVLSGHNAKISKLRDVPEPPTGCKGQKGPATCPLDGKCQTDELVYQATVRRTDTQTVETYTGLIGGTSRNATISLCGISEMMRMLQPLADTFGA